MLIVGIDEVGRGCWAGPLVAGAVLLHEDILGLNDSKLLTKRRREQLSAQVLESASYGLGWVSAVELDTVGLTAAVRLAMRRAVDHITKPYDKIIIDGAYNFLADNPLAETLIKADQTVPAVSAASIIAKVARDEYMSALATQIPGYGFERHVGYGTAEHARALESLGICKEHRLSFKPVAARAARL